VAISSPLGSGTKDGQQAVILDAASLVGDMGEVETGELPQRAGRWRIPLASTGGKQDSLAARNRRYVQAG
jgi:hypothetical protein